MRLQLTLLQRGHEAAADGERIGRWIAGALAEADAVHRAFEQLAEIERLDETAGGKPADVLRRVVALLAPLAAAQRVELDHDPGEATYDARGLARPLLAILSRCLLDAAPGTTVRLRATATGVELAPAPRDDGWRAELASAGWVVAESSPDRIILGLRG